MTQPTDRSRMFRQLHESGCFLVPNPWDLGSARLLAQLGFRALATTSSGFAWSLGRPDNHVSLEATLAHLRAISHGVEIPVSADFEGGFATAPEAVGAAVAPTPVNVLVGSDFATVAELTQAGVRRISVGGALARAAWAGFLQAAKEIAQHGTFTGLSRAVPFAEINRSFGRE